MIDLRNHGESPFVDSFDDLTSIAEDIAFTLKDYNKFTLFGHSLGGKIALVLASLYPEKVDGLLFVESQPYNLYDMRPDIVNSIFDKQEKIDLEALTIDEAKIALALICVTL